MNKITVERIKRNNPMNMSSAHYHDEYEIYYLVSGMRKYFIEQNVYIVKAGDFIIIPKNTLHKTTKYLGDKHERVLVSFFDEDIEKNILQSFSKFHIRPIYDKQQLADIITAMEYESKTDKAYSKEMLRIYLSQLLVLLYRQPDLTEAKNNELISNITAYINDNYAGGMSLELLAKKYHISKQYLSKKFKSETGFGICEYINIIRVENAAKMLRNEKCTITKAAFESGFNDSNYFASVFKKIKGENPKKYASLHMTNK